MLLAGSDLIVTTSEPYLAHILGRYGVLIIEHTSVDADQAIDTLVRRNRKVHRIYQLIQNDDSSTQVRLFLRRGLNVRYLLPAQVVDYVEQHGLYMDDSLTPSAVAGAIRAEKEKGKEKEMGASSSAAGGC